MLLVKQEMSYANFVALMWKSYVLIYFYWFEKCTNGLNEYCTFCDQECRAMIKHITTRWLSLERAVE